MYYIKCNYKKESQNSIGLFGPTFPRLHISTPPRICGLRVEGLELRDESFGFFEEGFSFWAGGLRPRVWGLEFRV